MIGPTREPDSFDPTVDPYPRYDAILQPCRGLLTEIITLQRDKPGKSPAAKAELDRARKRLRRVMRSLSADEINCQKSLIGIERVIRDLYGWDVHFDDERQGIWERLQTLLPGGPMNGVLTDLEDR